MHDICKVSYLWCTHTLLNTRQFLIQNEWWSGSNSGKTPVFLMKQNSPSQKPLHPGMWREKLTSVRCKTTPAKGEKQKDAGGKRARDWLRGATRQGGWRMRRQNKSRQYKIEHKRTDRQRDRQAIHFANFYENLIILNAHYYNFRNK